jgi:hypothetical protein
MQCSNTVSISRCGGRSSHFTDHVRSISITGVGDMHVVSIPCGAFLATRACFHIIRRRDQHSGGRQRSICPPRRTVLVSMRVLKPHPPQGVDGVHVPQPRQSGFGVPRFQKPTTIGSNGFCQLDPFLLVCGQPNIAETFLLPLGPRRVHLLQQPRWRTLCPHITRMTHGLSHTVQPTQRADRSQHVCRIGPLLASGLDPSALPSL